MSGRLLPASRSLRGFRSGSSISICLLRCSRASSSTARCSMAARDSGVKGRRQWGPGGTRLGRDELAILAFWAQGPEGGRQRRSSYSPRSLGVGGVTNALGILHSLPAQGLGQGGGCPGLLGAGRCACKTWVCWCTGLWARSIPHPGPHAVLFSAVGCATLQDQHKVNQIFSSLRNLGPMPQCPELSLRF